MAGFLPMWSPINTNIGDGSNLWGTALSNKAKAVDMLNEAVNTIRTNQQNSANAALLQTYQKALADGATPDEARASAAAAANPFVTADTLSNMFQNSRYDMYSNIQKAQEDRTAKDWQGQNEAARQSNIVNNMYLKRDQKGYNQALDNANSVLSDIALKYFKAPDLNKALLDDDNTRAQTDSARASAENSRAQAARNRAQAALDMSNLYEQKILDAYYAEKATLGLDGEPDEEVRADKIARLNKKYEQAYPGFMQIANRHGKQDILANTALSSYNTNLATNVTNDPVIRQKLIDNNADIIKKQGELLDTTRTYDEQIELYQAQGMSENDAKLQATKNTLLSLAKQDGDVALQTQIQEAKNAKDLQKIWAQALAYKTAPNALLMPSLTYTNFTSQDPSKVLNPSEYSGTYAGIGINDDGSLKVDKSLNTSIAELTQKQKQQQANIKEYSKNLRLANDVSLAILNGDKSTIDKYASSYDSLITALDNRVNKMVSDSSMGAINAHMLNTILGNVDKINNMESLTEVLKKDGVDPYTNFKGDKQNTLKYMKKAYTKLINSKNDKGQPFSKESVYGAIYMALSDPINKALGDNWINNISKTQLETYANQFEKASQVFGAQLKQADIYKRTKEAIGYIQKGQKAGRQGDAETFNSYTRKAQRALPR